MRVDRRNLCPWLEKINQYPVLSKVVMQQEPESDTPLICWAMYPSLLPDAASQMYCYAGFSGASVSALGLLPQFKTKELFETLSACRVDVVSIDIVPLKDGSNRGIARILDGGMQHTLDVLLLEVPMPLPEDCHYNPYYGIQYTDDGQIYYTNKDTGTSWHTILNTPGSIKELRTVMMSMRSLPQTPGYGNYITGSSEDPNDSLNTTEIEAAIAARLKRDNIALLPPYQYEKQEQIAEPDPEPAPIIEVPIIKAPAPKRSKAKTPVIIPSTDYVGPLAEVTEAPVIRTALSPELPVETAVQVLLETVQVEEQSKVEEIVIMTKEETAAQEAKSRTRRSSAEILEIKIQQHIEFLQSNGYHVEKVKAAEGSQEPTLQDIAAELVRLTSTVQHLANQDRKPTVTVADLEKIDLLGFVKQQLRIS